jgi:hypothetical protein
MSRPPVRISTWIIFGIALALVGFTIFLLKSPKGQLIVSTPTPTTEDMSLFPTDQVITINIKDKDGKVVELISDPTAGMWSFTKPRQGNAVAGSVDAAASQIPYMTIQTRLDKGLDPATYGLETPAYVITLEFQNGPAKSIEVGDATPTGSGYYAMLQDKSIVVIGKSGIDAILALFTMPPYAETETPTPLPATATQMATPTSLETATPEGTAENASGTAATETATVAPVQAETATATPTP